MVDVQVWLHQSQKGTQDNFLQDSLHQSTFPSTTTHEILLCESLTEEMARKGTSTSLSHHFLSQMLGDSSSFLATLFWIQIILDSILIDCPELQWYELTCDCSEKHCLSCTYRFHLESRLFAVL